MVDHWIFASADDAVLSSPSSFGLTARALRVTAGPMEFQAVFAELYHDAEIEHAARSVTQAYRCFPEGGDHCFCGYFGFSGHVCPNHLPPANPGLQLCPKCAVMEFPMCQCEILRPPFCSTMLSAVFVYPAADQVLVLTPRAACSHPIAGGASNGASHPTSNDATHPASNVASTSPSNYSSPSHPASNETRHPASNPASNVASNYSSPSSSSLTNTKRDSGALQDAGVQHDAGVQLDADVESEEALPSDGSGCLEALPGWALESHAAKELVEYEPMVVKLHLLDLPAVRCHSLPPIIRTHTHIHSSLAPACDTKGRDLNGSTLSVQAFLNGIDMNGRTHLQAVRFTKCVSLPTTTKLHK